jgi:hypothetical protein
VIQIKCSLIKNSKTFWIIVKNISTKQEITYQTRMAVTIILKNIKISEMLSIIMKNKFFQILEVIINTRMQTICRQPMSKWQLAKREKAPKNNYSIANTMKINLGNISFWGFYLRPVKNSKPLSQFTKIIFLIIYLTNLLSWCFTALIHTSSVMN